MIQYKAMLEGRLKQSICLKMKARVVRLKNSDITSRNVPKFPTIVVDDADYELLAASRDNFVCRPSYRPEYLMVKGLNVFRARDIKEHGIEVEL